MLAAAVALWYAKTAIFLAFAGIPLAIMPHSTSSALSRMTGLPQLASLAIVVVAITSVPMVLVAGDDSLNLALWVIGLYAMH